MSAPPAAAVEAAKAVTESAPAAVAMTGGKRSAWLTHVKKTARAHKGKSLKQVLKMASKTFKKSRKGGAALSPLPLSGGRKKTKKGSRRH